MAHLMQDLRYALRQLRKSPGFTAVAVITLALGIGANTAVFSVVDAVMLRPLPYYHPERLVEAQSIDLHEFGPFDVCYPDFFDWRTQNHTLEHLVSYRDEVFTLTGVERPVQIDAEIVSWDLSDALGIRPELGRGFLPDEEKSGSRVILISHALWTSQFGGDKNIVGQTVHLSGNVYTIVGVMPKLFRFPVTRPTNGIWTTLAVDDDPKEHNPIIKNRGAHFLNVLGRLKDGITVAQASQDLNAIAANLTVQYPKTNTRHNAARAIGEMNALLGDTRTALLVILGSVALVLLIACGNVANLLLARMRERQREMALRCALGAVRTRIIRQLLGESILLGVLGGLVGCGLAFLCTPAMLALIGDSVPRAADAGVDLKVLAFSFALAFITGIIFGIVPAITGSRTELVTTLKEGGRTEVFGHDWFRSLLIVGQVAMGCVLTVGAGLLISSFSNLIHTSQGFNPNHLTTMFFVTPDEQYKDKRPEFYGEYFEQVRALPGVQAAAGTIVLPMSDDGISISFENPEHPLPEGELPNADATLITPLYFDAMQIPVLEGRDFSDHDDSQSEPVMIVNRAFADKFFPGETALGKKLKPGAGTPHGTPWREIIGVVGDIRLEATQRSIRPAMYLPEKQVPNWCCLYTVLRSSLDQQSLAAGVQRILSNMDKNIPLTRVRNMDELMYRQLSQPRFAMTLLSTFAGLALVLTIVGLYGVMTYSVTRRTREIGVRMALGAHRSSMLSMILRDAAVLLASGIAIGTLCALATSSVLESMLYGTGARNFKIIVSVCLAMSVVGFLAAYIPARRAAKVDPMVALRYE